MQNHFIQALTQAEAHGRSQIFGGLHYQMHLTFDAANEKTFEGKVVIRGTVDLASLKKHPASAFLECHQAEVKSVKLHGKALTSSQYRYDKQRILFQEGVFSESNFELSIDYTGVYSTNGEGLHYFKDPIDGEVYLYTQFEADFAKKLLPCFDQPDMKATFDCSVEAPSHWEVVANSIPLTGKVGTKGGMTSWTFKKTEKIPTYLLAIVAGPYHIWDGNSVDGGRIPLRLLARKSVQSHIDYQDWLNATKILFETFERYFGVKHPFQKYDQIIVPQFNAGAMENVGAITFTERLVKFGEITPSERLSLLMVIAHEMAHQWFGNLVTPVWWDDLWLNESFAEFMGFWVLSKLEKELKLPPVWPVFYSRAKVMAYSEDLMRTTHPVAAEVTDTHQAAANFDGLTYGKGASIIKQLIFLIGEEKFMKAMQKHFEKFSYANATRSQFLETLSKEAGMDLSAWEKDWLFQSGVNSISVEMEKSGPAITSLKLVQEVDQAAKILRPHSTNLGFFAATAKGLELQESLRVSYSARNTDVPQAKGKKAPDLILPNYEDHDYVRVQIDAGSRSVLRKRISQIQDPLTRLMLWHTLRTEVQLGEFPAQHFIDMVMECLPQENDEVILADGWGGALGAKNSELAEKLRENYEEKLESYFLNEHQKRDKGSAARLRAYRSLMAIAKSEQTLGRLDEVLGSTQKGRGEFDGSQLDFEKRWQMVFALSKAGYQDPEGRIDREVGVEPGDKAEVNRMTALALIPVESNKKKCWSQIIGDTAMAVDRKKSAMAGLRVRGQEAITRFLDTEFLEVLPKMVKQESRAFLVPFIEYCAPGEPTPEWIERYKALHERSKKEVWPADATKCLSNKLEFLERRMKARALSAQTG